MQTNLAILFACTFFVPPAIGQEKVAIDVDVPALISDLASENPAPTVRRGPSLKFPPGYDRKKQESVQNARYKLKSLGPVAFEKLIASWGDERYCLTYSVGINGYMYNATVGRMCQIILYDQIQPYGIWPETKDDPRGKPKRPSYPSVFLTDAKKAAEWLEQHKGKTLYEIQLMVADWVIERESENPSDFSDEERKFMKDTRQKLLDTKQPISRGNYYMDDYD
jgi:hypothetical protein